MIFYLIVRKRNSATVIPPPVILNEVKNLTLDKVLVAPRSFAALEDDTKVFACAKTLVSGAGVRLWRNEIHQRWMKSLRDEIRQGRMKSCYAGFGVGRKVAFTHTAKCGKITEPPSGREGDRVSGGRSLRTICSRKDSVAHSPSVA